MNAPVFLDWFERKVLSAVLRDAVLVIDRASYHRTLTEETRPPKSNSRKADLIDWLVDRDIVVDGMAAVEEYDQLKRSELYEICKQNKQPTPMFEVQALAECYGCDVLVLPVGHPELNPIELVWARLKAYTAKRDVNFSLKEVQEFANEFIDSFDAAEWQKYVEHCIKIEDEYISAADTVDIFDAIDVSSDEESYLHQYLVLFISESCI